MHISNTGFVIRPSSQCRETLLERIGTAGTVFAKSVRDVSIFVFAIFRSLWKMLRFRPTFRHIDLLAEMEKAGPRAVPIVCLISFIVGMIIAFVGNMQLKMFGAEIYVAALVAISMVRILGAIMTGIIMAGRTGASYAAEIASMSANEEIDALKTMGGNPIEFLVLPRVLALSLNMIILTIVADIMAIFGGIVVAMMIMHVSIPEYLQTTKEWITFNNFAIGVLHGWLFGWVIAITGCWCGIRATRTASGVGHATTRAVVFGIVGCVITTAILTIIFNWIDI